MLIGLILRGVAFEFRVKATGWHREAWNRLFFVGSLVAAIAQGVMLGGVVTGFAEGPGVRALRAAGRASGLAGGYALLGATWLVHQDRGRPAARALRWSNGAPSAHGRRASPRSASRRRSPSAGIMEKWFAWPRIAVARPAAARHGGGVRRHLDSLTPPAARRVDARMAALRAVGVGVRVRLRRAGLQPVSRTWWSTA